MSAEILPALPRTLAIQKSVNPPIEVNESD
jgi:hypothetical protein